MARRLSSPVFIGRSVELERAQAARGAALAGNGGTLLVFGEAGIGKTRFCDELTRHVQGWATFSAACDEFGATARPLGPVMEIGRAVAATTRRAAPQDGDIRATLETLIALLDRAEQARDAGQISRLSVHLLQQLSEVTPVVIVVDDLHWADESTREFFRAAAAGLQQRRALVVGAYRDEELDRGHPLRSVLAWLHRSVRPETLRLPPFTENEAQVLAALLARDLDRAAVEARFARSGGNVFLLEELLSNPSVAIPGGAKDVLVARLDKLDSAARRLTEAAAIDTTLTREAMAAICGLEAGDAGFAETLDRVVASGLLVAESRGFRYRHALAREVAYDAITASRRPVLHRRYAEWLEHQPGSSAAEIAHHWSRTECEARAVATTIVAAREALRSGAIPESADLFDTVLAQYERLPTSQSGAENAVRNTDLIWAQPGSELEALPSISAVALHAVRAYQMSRRFERGIAALEGVLESRHPVAPTERALLSLRLAMLCWQNVGHEERDLPRVRPLLRAAMRLVPGSAGSDEWVRIVAESVTTWISCFGFDYEAEETWRALQASIATRPGTLTAAALEVATLEVATAKGESQPVEALNARSTEPAWQWALLPDLIVSNLSALGRHSEAIMFAGEVVPSLVKRGLGGTTAFGVRAHVARSQAAVGQWRAALQELDELRTELGPETLEGWDTVTSRSWGPVLARVGRLDEAAHYHSLAARWVIPYGMECFAGAQALVAVELARARNTPTLARAAVSEAVTSVCVHRLVDCGEAVALAIGLEADSARTPAEAAEALEVAGDWLRTLKSALDGYPARMNLQDFGMFLDQAEAECSRLAGADSPERWEELASRWRELGRPYHEAYCSYRAAWALVTAPPAAVRKTSREQAAAHLESAQQACHALGAVVLLQEVDSLARSAGLTRKRRAPTTAPRPTVSPLSPREMEVLRLVIGGESNGRIGVRLGISAKTASVHVSNIVRKLGASNRVDAAMRATRLGLIATHQ